MSSISDHVNSKHNSLWWLRNAVKNANTKPKELNGETEITSPNNLELNISSSVEELFENEEDYSASFDDVSDTDIGSIIDEINKIASQSPIGNFETPASERSVEEILKEAEKLYIESSKSFEQLSSKARTPVEFSIPKSKSSISFKSRKKSMPSPIVVPVLEKLNLPSDRTDKSIDTDKTDIQSPDDEEANLIWEKEDDDVLNLEKPPSELSIDLRSIHSFEERMNVAEELKENIDELLEENINELRENLEVFNREQRGNGDNNVIGVNTEEVEVKSVALEKNEELTNGEVVPDEENEPDVPDELEIEEDHDTGEIHDIEENHEIEVINDSDINDEAINLLNIEIDNLKLQLKETKILLENNELNVSKQTHILKHELEHVTEQLKDTQEQNTALQLQLDNLTKTHQELKIAYDELLAIRKNLESRISEIDISFMKCKNELVYVKEQNLKLSESETNLKKLLEIEKLQSKTARLQSEKDAKCIQDLNRQVKEMERIIQRKHPDSVSALIVASKNEPESSIISTRSLLENRIKQLESEASVREMQSTKVFAEVQEKFNNMKIKYESHIEDLETHVNDLKNQLKCKNDTYDIYTQTYNDEALKVDKDTTSVGIQTEQFKSVKIIKKNDSREAKTTDREPKEETHLLATIRGLQTDLTNKEKTIIKLQKEIDELRKTNRRLQKERECCLKGEKIKDNKQEKVKIIETPTEALEEELQMVKDEREKLKAQLCRLEEDFQNLKTKRIQDLNILQEAHEREITTYMSNIGPMREQLDVQQVSISTLQGQLASAKEELAIITVERDHLDSRLKSMTRMEADCPEGNNDYQISLQKKIAYLERRYEEREHRLRAIVHGLAQKQVTARDCAQCAARQQQLIGYKAELDQLLATLRYLQ